jgi:hypothetical protein
MVGLGADRTTRLVFLGVLMVVVVALIVLVVMAGRPRPPRGLEHDAEWAAETAALADADAESVRLLQILALFIAAYMLLVLLTNVFLDASTSLDGRLLLPMQIAAACSCSACCTRR